MQIEFDEQEIGILMGLVQGRLAELRVNLGFADTPRERNEIYRRMDTLQEIALPLRDAIKDESTLGGPAGLDRPTERRDQ